MAEGLPVVAACSSDMFVTVQRMPTEGVQMPVRKTRRTRRSHRYLAAEARRSMSGLSPRGAATCCPRRGRQRHGEN